MNIKIYNAAVAQLQANAMKQIVDLEAILEGPSTEEAVSRACVLSHQLVQSEGALLTLQQYFQAAATKAIAPVVAPDPIKITEEMSPTYRKSIEKEKIKASAKRNRKKNE